MSTNVPRAIHFPSEAAPLLAPLDASLPGDLALVDELLRDRTSLLERIAQGRDLARLARAMIVVGSSRVDLQACKLEYSIVSPK